MTTLSTYGELTTKALKCETDLTFQTADANSTVLRASDSSGDQIITIPAQSGNSNLLTSESSVAGAKLDINGATAETSPADADEAIVYDASATANKKMTLANLKTYFSAGSGVPSGSNNQIITYSGTTAQAVSMAGDCTIVADGTITLGADKVTTAKILDANVTSAKLASDAVTTAKILDDNVTAGKLANDAVTTDKILDANVTAGKLASDSVTTVKILDDAVTTAKILDANVTAGKLASDSVTTAKILDANVSSAKLATDSVTTAKIANNNVTNPKIAGLNGVTAGTVTALKLMLPDASKDISGFRNVTMTGAMQSASVLIGTSEWRLINSGTDLLFQKWSGSAWVTKSSIDGS